MAAPDVTTGRGRRAKPRKGDLREIAILDAAEALLERDGVEPLTVEAIARGAGLSRGSLYFYFGSKQEVLTALVARTVAVLRDDALAAAQDIDSPPAQTTARAIARTEQTWREHGRVMRAAVDYSAAIPEIGRQWNDTVEAYVEATTEVLVRSGLPRGKGATDAPALARTLCWMTERTFYLASQSGRPADLRRVTETCTEVWHRVIAGA